MSEHQYFFPFMYDPDQNNVDFSKELKTIVDENLNNKDFSIEFLCKKMGMSRSQLHRKTKATTGQSISHYVRHIRLQKAKELLDDSNLNISEIGYQVGISSPQNFTRYFTETFGQSPTNFRKNKRQPTHHFAKAESTQPSNLQASNEPTSKTGKWRAPTLMALITIGLAAGFFFTGILHPNNKTTTGKINSIAVIPFKNFSPKTESFLAEGIVEDILTHLTRFKDIRVISRTSSERYTNTNKNIKQIAHELGATYILEGSVRETDNQVRITVQLIHADRDQHLWAQNYDRPHNNIMQVQSEVALEIAKTLNQEISPDVRKHIQRLPTQNFDAYNTLIRGRQMVKTRQKDALEQSIHLFDQAVELDPGFAEASAEKAEALSILSNIYFTGHERDSLVELAEENALIAIKKNHQNAKAYATLGNVYRDQFRWQEALTAYDIALELNPNNALASYWKALTLRCIGDLEQSLVFHQKAAHLDPIYPVINAGYIYTAVLAKQYDLAHQLLERDKSVFPHSFLHQYVRGYLLFWQKKYNEAIHHLDLSYALNPGFEPTKSLKAIAWYKLGEKKMIEKYLAKLDTVNLENDLMAAKVYGALNQNDLCIATLQKAATKGHIPENLLTDPFYNEVLAHPQIIPILEQYDLLQYLNMQQ